MASRMSSGFRAEASLEQGVTERTWGAAGVGGPGERRGRGQARALRRCCEAPAAARLSLAALQAASRPRPCQLLLPPHQHALLVRCHAVGALQRLAVHLLPHDVLRGVRGGLGGRRAGGGADECRGCRLQVAPARWEAGRPARAARQAGASAQRRPTARRGLDPARAHQGGEASVGAVAAVVLQEVAHHRGGDHVACGGREGVGVCAGDRARLAQPPPRWGSRSLQDVCMAGQQGEWRAGGLCSLCMMEVGLVSERGQRWPATPPCRLAPPCPSPPRPPPSAHPRTGCHRSWTGRPAPRTCPAGGAGGGAVEEGRESRRRTTFGCCQASLLPSIPALPRPAHLCVHDRPAAVAAVDGGVRLHRQQRHAAVRVCAGLGSDLLRWGERTG